jgi:hypothetical protein
MLNFRLYNEQTVNGSRKIGWVSVFHFLFDFFIKHQNSMPMSPSLHFFMFICLHVYVSSSHVSLSSCLHVHLSMFPEFHKRKTELMETASTICWLQTEHRKGKLPFVFCKWKQKMEICFPWLANNNW